MGIWLQLVLVAAAAATCGLLLVLVLRRFRCSLPKQNENSEAPNPEIMSGSLQTGIAKLPYVSPNRLRDLDGRKRQNYYVFRRETALKPLFSWADNPSLVTDAVENGWSRFAFATSYATAQSPSLRAGLLGTCASSQGGSEAEVSIAWDVSQGSADFMQKIRLNPGSKRIKSHCSVIRTALPLPGPPLGKSSFPQEAYFEITILSPDADDDHDDPLGDRRKKKTESVKAKLIHENSITKANSESLFHFTSNNRNEEFALGGGKDDDRGEAVVLAVGLSRGGPLPLKVPGSHEGSIGFNSDGSVYLDGIKLVLESEKGEWGKTDKVIGCGYNPSQKKVFFTVDSKLVHVINCKSEVYGSPLYPTLAANVNTGFLVNLGQSVFKYSHANAQRNPNPCFIGPLAHSPVLTRTLTISTVSNSPALSYDDSRELFSMGRIDAQWHNRSANKSGHTNIARNYHNSSNNNSLKASDFDEESEGELFEIVLDTCGRSPTPITVVN